MYASYVMVVASWQCRHICFDIRTCCVYFFFLPLFFSFFRCCVDIFSVSGVAMLAAALLCMFSRTCVKILLGNEQIKKNIYISFLMREPKNAERRPWLERV